MDEHVYLDEKHTKIIKNSGVYERIIPFGFGKLILITTSSETDTGIIIGFNEAGNVKNLKMGLSIEDGVKFIERENFLPLTILNFPNSHDGIESINSLRHQLDDVESLIMENLNE